MNDKSRLIKEQNKNSKLRNEINCLKAENEMLRKTDYDIIYAFVKQAGFDTAMFAKIKFEGAKEFAERLKEEKFGISYCGSKYDVVDVEDIDNLLKEKETELDKFLNNLQNLGER